MNPALLLTYSRFILAPLFAVLFYYDMQVWSYIVLIIAIITDLLDGYVARKYGYETYEGMLLDPLADKVLFFIVILVLVLKLNYPLYVLILLLVKDLPIIIIGAFGYKKRIKGLGADYYGKISTLILFISIFTWMISFYAIYFVYLVVISQIITGIHYLVRFIKINRK